MPQYVDVPSAVSLLLIQELLERCRFKNHRLHVNWQSCIYGCVTDVEIQPLTEESAVQGASVIFKTPIRVSCCTFS